MAPLRDPVEPLAGDIGDEAASGGKIEPRSGAESAVEGRGWVDVVLHVPRTGAHLPGVLAVAGLA